MPQELPSSTQRPGETEPPTSRAELRYPPGAYYRRIALGTVLPGAGLLGTRWKVLGWLLVVLSLAAGTWVLLRAWQGGLLRAVLNVAVRPDLLQWVAVGIMVGAVLWVGSIVLTAEQTWPRHLQAGRWSRVLFAAAACTLVAAPSAMAVRYLDVQSSVIDGVFVDDSAGERRGPGLANTSAEDPWADVPRVNTLLIGSDAGRDRWGTRTDSMMVVSTNTKTGDTLLIGIPRNLERVPFPKSNPLHALYPNGYDCGDECLMNGIWTLAESHPDLFSGVENPGRKSTVDVVGEITGLEINQSVVVNLRGFKALVDAMGGVDVNVQQRVCVECHATSSGGIEFTGDKQEYIEPGLQHLDGLHALWYARSRAGSDDFSRMRRQRCVAGALMQQADPVGLLQRYPQLAKVVKNNVSIDIPREQLSAWVDLALRIQKGGSIRSLPLTSNVVEPGNPDFAKIRALVKKGLKQPASGESPSASPSPSSTPTPTPTRTKAPSTPSPTPTPDDSKAESLSATC
jgi:LCP family protein required for cell wall assembly